MGNLAKEKKVIVTGSSGNLGSLIVNNLPNYSNTCIDVKNPNYNLPLNSNFINFDISNKNLISLFQKLKPDVVIHSAFTVTPIKDKYRKKSLLNDLKSTNNVFKAGLKSGVSHIIYLSSTLAYGAFEKNKFPFIETDPLKAKSNFHYSFHKKLVEEKICSPFLKRYSKPILTVLRPSGVLGPNMKNYVTKLLKWKIRPFISEGMNTKIQWLHERDLLGAIICVLNLRPKGIYNITPDTSESYYSQSKFLPRYTIFIPETFSRIIAGIMWKFNISKTPPSYLDFVRYQFIASNMKAKNELKWSPKYTTKETLLSIYE